jgi:hypothetical protein
VHSLKSTAEVVQANRPKNCSLYYSSHKVVVLSTIIMSIGIVYVNKITNFNY